MDSFSNKSCMTISTDRTVNINLSDIVLQNLIDMNKVWSKLNEAKQKLEVTDDLFSQIEQYQSKEVSKFSVDELLYKQETKRFADIENEHKIDEDDDIATPVSITNLSGTKLNIHKIEDEEDKNSLIGTNIIEPEKVYQPITVEFEDDYYPIRHIELSKLHTGRHQLTDNIEDVVYYGVYLNRMQKVLTVRTYYTIHNQTAFTYILRVYNDD